MDVTIRTTKEIIKLFRKNNIRRQLIPSIPILCQTRWCEQHKSIRKFKEGFIKILDELDKISNSTSDAKTKSHMLYCAATKPSFVICLFIISKYSTLLEPITLKLQDKDINLIDAQNHIKQLVAILDHDRQSNVFTHIYKECEDLCTELDIQLKIPRTATHQTKRANYNTNDPHTYYKLSVFLPYIDSIKTSLNTRFSEENTTVFQLFNIYPQELRKVDHNQCNDIFQSIKKTYKCNSKGEKRVWYIK